MARTIGIDTGGTFTDVYAVDGDEARVAKLPSIPAQPARAVEEGLRAVGGGHRGERVVHGTTVALNALLTGRTDRAALVTNEGFRDLIELRRQERPDIYALTPRTPTPLVPRALRFELPQRLWPSARGEGFETVREPSPEELAQLVERVRKSRAESVAVCLLHSWADAEIERRVAEALAPLGLPVTCSAVLHPEHREFERFSTAVVNAALVPSMRAYLGSLEERVGGAKLFLLQSNGGTLAAARAALEPVRVLLSGPAGGVVGAARAAFEAGFGPFVALDMGGTSTDVAFHDAGDDGSRADARRAIEPMRIAGHPVAVPALDLHTIGCGGGSLVTLDDGGVLHVGPESAGADPGPVCYGRSDVPTVTDAHVLLGHIAEGPFLAGGLSLDVERVRAAFDELGARLGTTPEDAARGVLDVARAAMRRAIGVMTMQRGQDPERLPLVAFGGAGGLHAAALAESLGMRGALVPQHPGALSARGMTTAEPLRDRAHTVLEPLDAWSRARRTKELRALAREARAELVEAGVRARAVVFEHGLDLRYRGQSYEIRVPERLDGKGDDPAQRFHEAHERLYGYRLEREIELVCLRTRALAPRSLERPRKPRRRALPERATRGHRTAVFERARKARVIDRAALGPGHAFEGPALVEEYSGTTLVPPRWTARVSAGGHLLLEAK